jgi:prepilin-type N-terminal cleavage/methylation domain-containing protein
MFFRRESKESKKGFTILEMLVVIAMSGMIVTMLLNGLQHVMNLHHRFGVELDHNRQEAMRHAWLTQLIEGTHPDYPDGANKFLGSERELKGLSNGVFTQQLGVPTPFTLSLRYQPEQNRTILEYQENHQKDKTLVLLSWSGRRGRFTYLDNKQQAHDSWPPALDQAQQIPNSIQLEIDRDGQPWLLAYKPAGPVNPLPDITKFLAGAFK